MLQISKDCILEIHYFKKIKWAFFGNEAFYGANYQSKSYFHGNTVL